LGDQSPKGYKTGGRRKNKGGQPSGGPIGTSGKGKRSRQPVKRETLYRFETEGGDRGETRGKRGQGLRSDPKFFPQRLRGRMGKKG